MNILLIEILAGLFAAALLSLFIGWVIRGTFAKKEIQSSNTAWESKVSTLELQHQQDTKDLRTRVEKLDTESNQLAHEKESINQSLRENELSVQQARADAIELNRQQADTQERLQRIIAQKDEELKLFRSKVANSDTAQIGTAARATGTAALSVESTSELKPTTNNAKTTTASTASTTAATPDAEAAQSTEAKIASLSAKREAWEAERQRLIKSMGDDQETIAIDPDDLPIEQLDKTVRIAPEQATQLKSLHTRQRDADDTESDSTIKLEDDQTLLLDDNNMNSNRFQSPDKDKPESDDNDS